jgi:hypothetical protein
MSWIPSELKIRAGAGPWYKLVPLQSATPVKDIPEAMKACPIKAAAIQSMQDEGKQKLEDQEQCLDERAQLDEADRAAQEADLAEEDNDILCGWMFAMSEGEEEKEEEAEEQEEQEAKENDPACYPGNVRVILYGLRPEYADLRSEGLTARPEGCRLAFHADKKTWRSCYVMGSGTCRNHSREFGPHCKRTARQALLRVIELMLEDYVSVVTSDKLAISNLRKVTAARRKESPHTD